MYLSRETVGDEFRHFAWLTEQQAPHAYLFDDAHMGENDND